MADINQNPNPTVNTVEQKKKPSWLKKLQDKKAARKAKKEPKEKKEKKPRRPFKVVMKTWSKGLGKEASRVTWEKKSNVAKDFITIIVIAVILALVFFAIDLIILSARK